MAQDGTSDLAGMACSPPQSAANSDTVAETAQPGPEPTADRPSAADTMWQAPTLVAGENIADYQALAAEVSDAVQPKTFFERLAASELCQALWEERRFRRQQAALPNATRMKALVCLLASNGFENDALDIASSYFGGDAEERSKATNLVRRYGITDDAISAQASEQYLPILSTLERLVDNRQSRRDVIVSEYHRRKRKADKLTSRQSVGDPLSDRPAVARH